MDTIISATLCTEVLSTIGNTIYLHGKLWSILGHVRAFNLVQKIKEHYPIAFCLYSFFISTYNIHIFLSEMFIETLMNKFNNLITIIDFYATHRCKTSANFFPSNDRNIYWIVKVSNIYCNLKRNIFECWTK